jgi:hypothetical protein
MPVRLRHRLRDASSVASPRDTSRLPARSPGSVRRIVGILYLDLSNQCAANVPQDVQTREFCEAFEGTPEPSVRAFVEGKRLIRLGGQHFLQCLAICLTSRRSQVRVLHCPPFQSITYRVYCLVAAHNDSQLSFPNQTFPRSRSSDIAGLPGRGGNRRRPVRY